MYLFESIAAAAIPMLAYTVLIWKMDKFEREPVSLILKSFLYGATIAVIFSLIGSTLVSFIFSFFNIYNDNKEFIDSVFIAPFVEEFCKGFLLFFLVYSHHFDDIVDGLVYGSAIGLGFGMTENFLYFFSETETFYGWILLVVIRSLFSAVMHGIATAFLGALIAIKKFSKRKTRIFYPFVGFLIAFSIHFLWNYTVSSEHSLIFSILFILLIIIFYIIIFKFSLLNERKIILDELIDEARNGTISFELVAEINKFLKSNSLRKNFREIARIAIQLAFRKHQIENSPDKNLVNDYQEEVKQLREKLTLIKFTGNE